MLRCCTKLMLKTAPQLLTDVEPRAREIRVCAGLYGLPGTVWVCTGQLIRSAYVA